MLYLHLYYNMLHVSTRFQGQNKEIDEMFAMIL